MKTKRYFNHNFLIALRRKAGERQQDLADAIGVSLTTVGNWELAIKAPERKNVYAIAEHYNVDWTLFISKAEQIAWQNYQLGIMLGHGTHDDHRADAINLNALPEYQPTEEEPSEAQQEDDDLLDESETPQVG